MGAYFLRSMPSTGLPSSHFNCTRVSLVSRDRQKILAALCGNLQQTKKTARMINEAKDRLCHTCAQYTSRMSMSCLTSNLQRTGSALQGGKGVKRHTWKLTLGMLFRESSSCPFLAFRSALTAAVWRECNTFTSSLSFKVMASSKAVHRSRLGAFGGKPLSSRASTTDARLRSTAMCRACKHAHFKSPSSMAILQSNKLYRQYGSFEGNRQQLLG